MKELNKLIEGIAWPITYDGKSFRDKKCRVISETLIAHALNNLQPKGNLFLMWLEQRFGSAEVDVIIQDAARWNSLREEYKKHLDKPKAKCSERCDWPNCTLDGCRQREIDPDWGLQPKEGELQADADAKFYYEGSVSGERTELCKTCADKLREDGSCEYCESMKNIHGPGWPTFV